MAKVSIAMQLKKSRPEDTLQDNYFKFHLFYFFCFVNEHEEHPAINFFLNPMYNVQYVQG